MIPWAHSSTQPKRHLDQFSRFAHRSTAECPYTLQWDAPPPQNLPLPTGDLDPHPSPQPKRHLDRFSRFCRAHYCDRQIDRQTTLLGQ